MGLRIFSFQKHVKDIKEKLELEKLEMGIFCNSEIFITASYAWTKLYLGPYMTTCKQHFPLCISSSLLPLMYTSDKP